MAKTLSTEYNSYISMISTGDPEDRESPRDGHAPQDPPRKGTIISSHNLTLVF